MKKNIVVLLLILVGLGSILFCVNHRKKFVYREFINPVRIVFITDNNYVLPTRTVIRSIAANKAPETEIEIYIIGVKLSNKNNALLTAENKEDIHLNFISFSKKNINDFPMLDDRFSSKADNAKFFLPEILQELDKVIYMDGDVIVKKDLSELYFTDLGDNYVAAADDWQSSWENDINKRYFNNGVMLLNLKKMREDNVSDKLIKLKKENPSKRFVTQDTFNQIMYGKVKFLPLQYNTFAPEYDSKYVLLGRIGQVLKNNYDPIEYPYDSVQDFKDDVYIIHYCGWNNMKPWLDINFMRESSRLWYKYAPLSFWWLCMQGKCSGDYFYAKEFNKLNKGVNSGQ